MQKLNLEMLKNDKSEVIKYIESMGYTNVDIIDNPENNWERDISFNKDNDRIILCFKENESNPIGLTFKLDMDDTIDNPIIDYDISNVCFLENKYYGNKYFWVDPSFNDGSDSNKSNLCEIVDYPLLSMLFKCYSKIEYNDYDHNDDDAKLGLEIGDFGINGECFESYENTWFETEEQRDKYIQSLNVLNVEDVVKKDYYNNPDIYTDLRNYPYDTIFNIKTINGSEAEVFQNELMQLVKIDEELNYSLFVKFTNEENDTKMFHSPMLKNGIMSPLNIDYNYIKDSHKNLPLNILVSYYFLKTNFTSEIRFDFEGNSDIEAFYARIESFKLDTDNTIIATLVDMEDNHFDVSWDEIKNSEFQV